MKIIKNKISLILFMMVPFLICLLPSCSQKNQDCTAVVHVVDANQNPVAGVKVILHKTNITGPNAVSANVSQTGTTDAGGAVTMTFPLPAVLDVNISKGATSGTGQIRLEPAQTVTQTLVIQ